MSKNEYYDYYEIDRTGANWRIIYGERSNGKTYGFKKKAIENYITTGKQFAYVRRRREEAKASSMSELFKDMTDYINESFKPIYPDFDSFAIIGKVGKFTIYGYKENEMKELGTIGFYFILSTSRYHKSIPYPDVTLFCYDEFMTDGLELPNEFSVLLNLISTIKRKRTDFTIYLLGNTVDRNSSILKDININIRDIPQGAIKCYEFGDGSLINKVAVEHCRHYEQVKESEQFFVFNTPREMMIRNGEWETSNYECFTLSEFYNNQFSNCIIFDSGQYRLYGYISNNGYMWITDTRMKNLESMKFLTFHTGETYPNRMIFNWNCPEPKIINIRKKLDSLIYNRKVKYKNNLVGDDFESFRVFAENKKTSL